MPGLILDPIMKALWVSPGKCEQEHSQHAFHAGQKALLMDLQHTQPEPFIRHVT